MRRRILPALALVLIAVACTSNSDETSTTEAGAGSSPTITDAASSTSSTSSTIPPDGFGGEVTIGMETSVGTLNPFSPNAFNERLAGNLVWALVYDIAPETWERTPESVTTLPSDSGNIEVNDDGTMTVRYEVRQGLVWSDGEPMTGEDVAFTAEAMRDMALSGIANVPEVMGTVLATDSVDRLAYITFSEPTLAFEDALWIILPRHALEGVDLIEGTDGSDWPSGGPFVVAEFDPFGAVRFERNEQYWKTDDDGRALPYLDAVVITDVGDEPQSPAPDFVLRALDVALVNPWDADLRTIEGAEPDGAVLTTAPSPVIEHITFEFAGARDDVNPGSENGTADYREAVAMSLDRPAILAETGVPWYPGVPGMLIPVGTSPWEQYSYDPSAAGNLIDGVQGDSEASIQARLTTTGNGDYRIRIGDALTTSFDAIGVDYEPIYLDSVLFFGETLETGAFDLGMWAWISDGGPQNQLALLDHFNPAVEPPTGNYGRWDGGESADRFTEIVAEAHTTVDPERFDELIAEAEDILATELPIIPLFNRAIHVAYWSDVVTGIVPNGSASTVTWNIESWQRVGE